MDTNGLTQTQITYHLPRKDLKMITPEEATAKYKQYIIKQEEDRIKKFNDDAKSLEKEIDELLSIGVNEIEIRPSYSQDVLDVIKAMYSHYWLVEQPNYKGNQWLHFTARWQTTSE